MVRLLILSSIFFASFVFAGEVGPSSTQQVKACNNIDDQTIRQQCLDELVRTKDRLPTLNEILIGLPPEKTIEQTATQKQHELDLIRRERDLIRRELELIHREQELNK